MDELEYFVKRTDERLGKIEDKIDQVLAFKWQIIGGSLVVSALLSIGIRIFFK